MMQLWHLSSWAVGVAVVLLMSTPAKTQSCARPPVIREADSEGSYSFLTKTEDAVLVLRCDGDAPVDWIVDPILRDSTTVTNSMPGSSKLYTSTFKLSNPYIEDTGFFTCVKTQSNCSSEVYVFINSGEDDFVNPDELLTVQGTTDDVIIIDCRTTSPHTNVTLYKDGSQITDYPYDVKRGFIIDDPAITMSGLLECRINNADTLKTLDVMLKVTSSTTLQLPVPVIKPLPNTHFVVGHPFRLECTVPSTNPITFEWTHIDEDPTGFKPETVANREKTKKSIHSEDAASLEDSGVYQCKVSQKGYRPARNNITITILKSKTPVLNMTSEPFVIHVKKSQEVFWKVMVEFYPMIPEVAYYDPRNERVKQSHRINSTFNSVTGESRLQINDVQPSDFGNWTLVARTDLMTANTSVRIIVTSAPEAHLVVPSSVMPGPAAGVACEVTAYYRNALGFVVPDVSLKIANCTHLSSGCPWEKLDLETNVTRAAENRLVFEPIVAGSPLASMSSSAWLQCETSYPHSPAHADQKLLVVTDLSDRWEFSHMSDDKKRRVLQDKYVEMAVVDNDQFQLWCGATDSLYNPPTLTFSSNTTSAIGDLGQTNYSSVIHYNQIKIGKEQAGSYTCSVSQKQGLRQNKTLVITVKDEKPITLHSNTLELGKTLEVYIEVGDPVDIVCNPDAAPMPHIEWLKDGKPLDDPSIVHNHTTLHFDFFAVEDQGLYTCDMTRRGKKSFASVHYYVDDRRAKISRIVLYAAGGVIVILGVAFAYLVHRVLRERAKSRERNAAKLALFKEGKVDQINRELRLDEQADLLPYDQKYEVTRDRIFMGRQLGSGAFGRVVKAEVKGLDEHDPDGVSPVAIKMTKSLSDPSHVKNLGSELKIMIHLGKHLNIVNLIGANTERIAKNEIWILVEYCRYGDLLSFVQKYRRRFVNQVDPINDSINYSILPLTPNSAALPFSPGVNNNHRTRDRPSVSSAGPDGYLMPNSAVPPIVLADPPKGHSTRSSRATSPQDPRSPTDSVAFFADNPGYGRLEAAASGSSNSVPQTPVPASDPTANSPTAASQILLSPISEVPQEYALEAMPTVTHSPSSLQSYNALNRPPPPASPYVNVGIAQSSPRSPPPYVSQGFVPPSSPEKNTSAEAVPPSYGRSNSYRSGSVGGPYNRINTDMTTVSSPRPFSPTYSEWRDSESGRSGTTIGKGIPGLESPFTTTELLCWSWQVAQGMDYLTKRKVLHGDLAARNLLLAEGNVIKISDFGLSRDIYKNNYLKQSDDLMPIKWMSIEAIRDRCFSVESDVWAYGITLWELFSLGMAPYPGMDVNPDFLKSLEEGKRNDRPKFSNKKIYEIMLDCWEEEPEMRPSFASIMARLRPMIPREVLENFDTMNENYLQMNEAYFKQRTDYLNMFLSPEFNNLQKPEQAIHPGYMDFQALNEEDRLAYQKMMSSQYGPAGDGGGYLSMTVMGEQLPPENVIFSPNPVVSASDAKRFTFHSTEDLVPPTQVPSPTPYSSNAPSCYALLPQSPCETSSMNQETYPRTCDEAEERNSFLQSDETDESDSGGTSIANPHYHNYRV